MGASVISCDHLGHAAYKKDKNCYKEMVQYFGDTILNAEGEIDRKKLGPIVFSNKVINRFKVQMERDLFYIYIMIGSFDSIE